MGLRQGVSDGLVEKASEVGGEGEERRTVCWAVDLGSIYGIKRVVVMYDLAMLSSLHWLRRAVCSHLHCHCCSFV